MPGQTATGSIAFNDVDLTDAHTATAAAKAGNATSLGTFAVGAVTESATTAEGTVAYTYTLNNGAAQYSLPARALTRSIPSRSAMARAER
jgi:hypothetical protein